MNTIRNFILEICRLVPNWSMDCVLESQKRQIRSLVGNDDHVVCALSGGVDSTVAAVLVHEIIGDRLHCVFVDHGLLRYKASYHSRSRFVLTLC